MDSCSLTTSLRAVGKVSEVLRERRKDRARARKSTWESCEDRDRQWASTGSRSHSRMLIKMFILNEREKTGKGRDSRFLKLLVASGVAVLTMRLASRYIFKPS